MNDTVAVQILENKTGKDKAGKDKAKQKEWVVYAWLRKLSSF